MKVQDIIRDYIAMLVRKVNIEKGVLSACEPSEELLHLWNFVKSSMLPYFGDDTDLTRSWVLLERFNGDMNEEIVSIKIDDVHGQWMIESENYIFFDGFEKKLVKKSDARAIETFNKSIKKGKFTTLDGIYTFAEACKLWRLGESTLRKANLDERFQEGEVRQSGSTWLVTKQAMERLYGKKSVSPDQ